ncbi:MAG: ThiF family adenylyltransferase [Actinomycetota bacterium]|jgi:molybdopterin/thiamine biosynthesis adenylyltransferase|nr:ThiF family adenylyltransferase [Actinomycetota bacterium]
MIVDFQVSIRRRRASPDETNLGRHVGATAADVDHTLKVDIAKRVINGIDESIEVRAVAERFPSRGTIAALKEADVVVACLDRFDAREDVNAFCRRYLIPLVDVGMTIRSTGENLARARTVRSSSRCPATPVYVASF